MIKAIIFDFNGIIIDDEPLHFAAMRDVVADYGISLTKEAYWARYLPLDDAECLQSICRDNAFPLNEAELKSALVRKSHIYKQLLSCGFSLFPGVARFIDAAAELYPLAIASGAAREEIVSTLEISGLKRYFLTIVAAEDFHRGKPQPDSYLLALERFNAVLPPPHIHPAECLVIEDSVGGIRGARAAGMACLAVSNSYPSEMLAAANRVVASLVNIQPDSLRNL